MLDGKIVLISSLSAGLSTRLAIEATRAGAQVIVTQQPGERLEAGLAEIAAEQVPREVVSFPGDCRNRDQCHWVVEQSIQRFGRIDALIVGAGSEVGTLGPVESADLDAWRGLFDENFFAPVALIQEVLPHMRTQRSGRIVNVSAIAARRPVAGHAGYAASKAALACATAYLAMECSKWGISVNTAFLGWTWGSATAARVKRLANDLGTTVAALKSEITEGIPLGYIPEEADCARTVLMLLSGPAAVMTGASIDINGGEFIPL
jgi:NAD(P)-dependent dehydrogenase (short-subunit alcohol dehydrogenase family)